MIDYPSAAWASGIVGSVLTAYFRGQSKGRKDADEQKFAEGVQRGVLLEQVRRAEELQLQAAIAGSPYAAIAAAQKRLTAGKQ